MVILIGDLAMTVEENTFDEFNEDLPLHVSNVGFATPCLDITTGMVFVDTPTLSLLATVGSLRCADGNDGDFASDVTVLFIS
jgi:hypothetical protein